MLGQRWIMLIVVQSSSVTSYLAWLSLFAGRQENDAGKREPEALVEAV